MLNSKLQRADFENNEKRRKIKIELCSFVKSLMLVEGSNSKFRMYIKIGSCKIVHLGLYQLMQQN